MSVLNNALSFDIEDWFQVENLRTAVSRAEWDRMPMRVEANTQHILALLRRGNVKATFFFLGWVAERCPQLVRDVAAEGHEIASHGYGHELVYRMTPADFRDDIRRSKAVLESLCARPVVGYRAPSFSITPSSVWAIDVLREEGFQYDSSVFPVSGHDRYGFANADTSAFRWPNGLWEIPLAVYKVGKLSLPVAGGGYFRLFPYRYFRALLRRLNANGTRFTFYLHPWEFDPGQPRLAVPWLYRFRHYVNLAKTSSALARLLDEFAFDTIASAYDLSPTAR